MMEYNHILLSDCKVVKLGKGARSSIDDNIIIIMMDEIIEENITFAVVLIAINTNLFAPTKQGKILSDSSCG